MRALEILGQEMEVFHRRPHLRVPEDDREAHDIPTVPEVLGCEGVTEEVEPALRQAKVLQEE